ncbi:MAG TPA: glycosyltransferase [Pyrinomonadaceae bacterium]|nr:glycosyltransferase [Pyrinomonadaceae bacterium]
MGGNIQEDFRSGRGEAATLEGARVIIVIGPLELGGAERQALLLGRHLARERGAEVEVWGYGKPGRAAELCEEYGIKWRVAPIPLPWSDSRLTQLRRLVAFARALRAARPDVILPFMFFQSVVCGLVWKLTGARACVWNQRCEGRDRLGRRAEKLAIRLTPYFIANSEHGAGFLVNTLGVREDLVRVVHNGVRLAPPQEGRAAWRARLGVGDDCFLACMVANLQTFKDHVTLLKAWRLVVKRLRAEGREAVLLLAGRFDETHIDLKALAYDLELGRSVRFLGQVKDVSGLLSAVDLGVHSSVNEGCPNGVLECMAAGLAVAGTDYPGIREAVGPAGYAHLAPPGDAEALAERVVALALDAEARQTAGEANRRRIETEFHPRKMFEETESVIAAAMRGASSEARESSAGGASRGAALAGKH